MEKTVLNYRIIIEPEHYEDGSKVYVANCPTLGVTDYGDSVEEVLKSIRDGIELAVSALTQEEKEIPVDNITHQIIATTQVQVPIKLSRISTS